MAFWSGPWRSLQRLARGSGSGAVASTSALSASVPNTTADEPIIATTLTPVARPASSASGRATGGPRRRGSRCEHPLRRTRSLLSWALRAKATLSPSPTSPCRRAFSAYRTRSRSTSWRASSNLMLSTSAPSLSRMITASASVTSSPDAIQQEVLRSFARPFCAASKSGNSTSCLRTWSSSLKRMKSNPSSASCWSACDVPMSGAPHQLMRCAGPAGLLSGPVTPLLGRRRFLAGLPVRLHVISDLHPLAEALIPDRSTALMCTKTSLPPLSAE